VGGFLLDILIKENPCDRPGFIILFLVVDTEKKENTNTFITFKSALKHCRHANYRNVHNKEASDSEKKNLAKENQITLTRVINVKDKNIPINQHSLLLHDSNLNNAEVANEIFTNCKDGIKKHISNLYQENLDAIDSFVNMNGYTLKESQQPDQLEKVSNGINKLGKK